MAKGNTLTKQQNDANLAAIEAAKKGKTAPPPLAAIKPSTGTIRCTACNRELSVIGDDGKPRVTCVCGASYEAQS